MSKPFETIFVQMRRPRDGDPGVTEPGYFRVEDDVVVLVDKNGVPRLNKKGKRLEYKLKAGPERPENCGATDSRPHAGPPRTTFTVKLFIQTREILKWLFTTNSAIPQSRNLTYATSAGTAVSTAGFGAQTYYISITAPGAATTTGGVRYLIGNAAGCHDHHRRAASVQLDTGCQSHSRRAAIGCQQ